MMNFSDCSTKEEMIKKLQKEISNRAFGMPFEELNLAQTEAVCKVVESTFIAAIMSHDYKQPFSYNAQILLEYRIAAIREIS